MTWEQIKQAAILWAAGLDPLRIAERLGLRESVVFNHIHELRRCIPAPGRAA